MQRQDLGLNSHPKECWGNGVRTHVNSKGKIPSGRKILLRGGWSPRRYIKQDSEPNTPPTSYSCPQSRCKTARHLLYYLLQEKVFLSLSAVIPLQALGSKMLSLSLSHTHTHTHVHTHTYIFTHTRTCIHACACAHTHTQKETYSHVLSTWGLFFRLKTHDKS